MVGATWVVLAVLVAAARAGPTPVATDQPVPFSLDEVISGALSPRGFGGTWVTGNQFLFTTAEGHVALHNVVDDSNTTVLDKNVTESLGTVSSYTMSAGGDFLLLSYDVQAGFRHSSTAKFAVYSIANKNVSLYLHNENYLQLATWSPQGNHLAYVYQNNIYLVRSSANGAWAQPIQLTSDGEEGVIYNGVPDWVYEEEVLGSGSAMWFSPDGNSLAFAKFNDKEVQNASYMHYGNPGDINDQYSTVVTIRYPKVGTANPKVELYVVTNLTSTASTSIPLLAPASSVTEDHVLWDVSWANSDEVIVTWTNRVQNVAQITSYSVTTGSSTGKNERLISQENGWLMLPRPVFDLTGQNFLTIHSWPHENSGNFSHVTLVKRQQGSTITEAEVQQLTSGDSVVTNIYGWDTVGKKIYYQSTEPGYPSRRRLYVVPEAGGEPQCLSCNISGCEFASASFSSDLSHYARSCAGPQAPNVVTIVNTGDGREVKVWQDNAELKAVLSRRLLPTIVNTEVQVDGGYNAQVRLWLPPNMDNSGNTKYPLVVFVYGGPGSQQITDSFTLGWGAYLVSNRSYIYAMIDGRGSANKGDAMLFELYHSLGTKEVQDQTQVAKELANRYPYIDKTRMGIWGWSYGGYATAMALAQDKEDVFKCGISVAPVTSWIYYDSIYTERYMGLLSDNRQGYDDGDVNRLVDNFANKEFFLMHGNADDNVHYQQAMVLAKALEAKNILFSQQSYPDENHSIRSVLSHVYHSQDKFWERCFAQPTAEDTGAATTYTASMAVIFVLQAILTVIML